MQGRKGYVKWRRSPPSLLPPGLSAMADIQVTLVKTPEGVGMNIAADGTVLSYTSSGGPAEAAGIPLKSKIVTVNGSPSLPA